MLRTTSILPLTILMVACGGSGSSGVENNGVQFAPEIGAAAAPPDTQSLEVDKDFSFSTARTVDIEFNIESAANDEASVTICTDYKPLADEFDINFNTCTISGELEQGVFKHSMEVTNDKESVVAVVLFQNSELVPMYKEFKIDSNQRTKSDGSTSSVIVW